MCRCANALERAAPPLARRRSRSAAATGSRRLAARRHGTDRVGVFILPAGVAGLQLLVDAAGLGTAVGVLQAAREVAVGLPDRAAGDAASRTDRLVALVRQLRRSGARCTQARPGVDRPGHAQARSQDLPNLALAAAMQLVLASPARDSHFSAATL